VAGDHGGDNDDIEGDEEGVVAFEELSKAG